MILHKEEYECSLLLTSSLENKVSHMVAVPASILSAQAVLSGKKMGGA